MADETKNKDGEQYEEPSMLDLEDVAGGLAEGACATSGSGSLCTGGCGTSGSSLIEAPDPGFSTQ